MKKIMRNCIVETDREAERTVMRLTSNFDRDSALQLRDALRQTEGAVLLDFSLVHDFDDLGVATLARVLIESKDRRRIRVCGLRQHQLRLFRYIGIDVDELAGASQASDTSTAG